MYVRSGVNIAFEEFRNARWNKILYCSHHNEQNLVRLWPPETYSEESWWWFWLGISLLVIFVDYRYFEFSSFTFFHEEMRFAWSLLVPNWRRYFLCFIFASGQGMLICLTYISESLWCHDTQCILHQLKIILHPVVGYE